MDFVSSAPNLLGAFSCCQNKVQPPPAVAREVGPDLVPAGSSDLSPATLSSLMDLQLCGLLSAPQTHFKLSPSPGTLRVLHPLLERLFPHDLLCWLHIFLIEAIPSERPSFHTPCPSESLCITSHFVAHCI